MRVKKLLLLLPLLAFLSCNQGDSKKKETIFDSTKSVGKIPVDSPMKLPVADTVVLSPAEQVLHNIKKECDRINLVDLDKKKYPFACPNSPSAGNAIFFSEGGKVVKITVDWGFAGDYTNQSAYYFTDEKMIFEDDVSVGGPANSRITETRDRTFINDDKAVKYMRNEKVLPCQTCQFNPTSEGYKLLKAFHANKVNAVLCE